MRGLFCLLDFSLIWGIPVIRDTRLDLLSLANRRFKFKKRRQLLILYSLRQTTLESWLSAVADQRTSKTPQNQCARERVNCSDGCKGFLRFGQQGNAFHWGHSAVVRNFVPLFP